MIIALTIIIRGNWAIADDSLVRDNPFDRHLSVILIALFGLHFVGACVSLQNSRQLNAWIPKFKEFIVRIAEEREDDRVRVSDFGHDGLDREQIKWLRTKAVCWEASGLVCDFCATDMWQRKKVVFLGFSRK